MRQLKEVNKNSSLWVKILKAKYLRNSLYFLKEEILPKGSDPWNNLLNYHELLRKGMN